MTPRCLLEIPHIHTDENGKTWLTMGWVWVALFQIAIAIFGWRIIHR